MSELTFEYLQNQFEAIEKIGIGLPEYWYCAPWVIDLADKYNCPIDKFVDYMMNHKDAADEFDREFYKRLDKEYLDKKEELKS